VINKQPSSDYSAGMNFYTRDKPGNLGYQPRDEKKLFLVKLVSKPMEKNRMKPRIQQYNL